MGLVKQIQVDTKKDLCNSNCYKLRLIYSILLLYLFLFVQK